MGIKEKIDSNLSIIVPTWNNADQIVSCLNSVNIQNIPGLEILVVDNGSVDYTKTVVKNFPNVKLIENDKNLGFAVAMNQGIKQSKGKYIFALNSDVVLEKDYISSILKLIETDSSIGWACGKLLRMDSEGKTKIIDSAGHFLFPDLNIHNRGVLELDKGQYDKNEFVFGACAAAALYKKEALLKAQVEGEIFDEDFFSFYEDADLDWRLHRQGYRCLYVPAAVGYHYRGGISSKTPVEIQLHYKKNRYLFMVKNAALGIIFRNLPWILLTEIKNLFLCLNKPHLFIGYWKALRFSPRAFKKRNMIMKMYISKYNAGEHIIRWGIIKCIKSWSNRCRLKNKTDEDKINVVYVIISTALAGTEQELINILSGADRNKFSNFVVCAQDGPLVGYLRDKGWDVRIIKHINRVNLIALLRFYFLLKTKRAGIVCLIGNRIAAIAAKIHGAITVQRRNQPTAKIRKLGRIKAVNSFLDLFIDRIIAVSEAIRQDIIKNEKLDPRKLVTIYNGVDESLYRKPDNISILLNELGLDAQKPVVGIIARLEEQKGHKYFLEAARMINEVNPAVQFLIVGDGSLRQSLEDMVKRSGLTANVRFCGFRTDVAKILYTINVFVLSSLWEGFPFAILEAMVCGIPVVVTDVGGVKELIKDGVSGILVPSADPTALADAVLRLIKDKELSAKIAKEARHQVAAEFTLYKMVEKTEWLYRKLLTHEKN